jgi:hypothetical protein
LKKILGLAKNSYKSDKSQNFIVVAISSLVLLTILYFTEYNFFSDTYWTNYIFLNLSLVFIAPLLILSSIGINGNPLALKKYYLKFVFFVLVIVLYLFILKLICQGDPILNLVRLVLICWGFAIIFPVPYLIFTRNESVLKSIARAYIAGKYMRWHQFMLCLIVSLVLILPISIAFLLFSDVILSVILFLLILPIPSAIQFSGHLMMAWNAKQEEFQLYDKQKDY